MKIGRIFLSILAMLGVLQLAACKLPEPRAVDIPPDISAVTLPFIDAIKRNEVAKAQAYISTYERDDAVEEFSADHAMLTKTPALKPQMFQYNRDPFGQPDKKTAKIWYMAHSGKLWTELEIKLSRVDGGKYEIDYYSIKQSDKMPEMLTTQETVRKWVFWGALAAAITGIAFLGFLIWLIRRRTHMFVSDSSVEARVAATTVQED